MINSIQDWKGTISATSPLTHGGEALGTTRYLKRTQFFLPSGAIESIPIVSGNAVKGALRDLAANMYYDFLGHPQLTLPQSHLLWSGGAIAKARQEPITGQQLRFLRQQCPPLALMGGAIAGRVISGSINVGSFLPICQELVHLIPEEALPAELVSYWDLTQLSHYSRFPDHEDEEGDDKSSLMRYSVESFLPGTMFYWHIQQTSRNSIEHAFFHELINQFLDGKIRLGGNKARGYGQIRKYKVLNPIPPPVENWEEQLLKVSSREDIIQILKKIK